MNPQRHWIVDYGRLSCKQNRIALILAFALACSPQVDLVEDVPQNEVEYSMLFNSKDPVYLNYLVSREKLKYADKGSYQFLLRPLGERGAYDIAILLPGEADGLPQLLNILPSVDWKGLLGEAADTEVSLRIPEFDISSSYDVSACLKKLGVERAFSADAQFPNMFEGDNGPCLSKVLHKARIMLSDNGVEAASATAAVMEDIANYEPEDPRYTIFHAYHPFVYAVTERSSGTILFAGVFDGN